MLSSFTSPRLPHRLQLTARHGTGQPSGSRAFSKPMSGVESGPSGDELITIVFGARSEDVDRGITRHTWPPDSATAVYAPQRSRRQCCCSDTERSASGLRSAGVKQPWGVWAIGKVLDLAEGADCRQSCTNNYSDRVDLFPLFPRRVGGDRSDDRGDANGHRELLRSCAHWSLPSLVCSCRPIATARSWSG